MKKIVLTIIALFLVNLCISAQIQRKFYDFTLGETSKTEVKSYLNKKKKSILDERGDVIMVPNMRFAGQEWNLAVFIFYKGKLESVYFSFDDVMNSRESVNGLWKHLKKSLDSKYSEYYSTIASNEQKHYYQDSMTNVFLNWASAEGVNAVTLMYTDNEMSKEHIAEEENEL